MRDGYVWGRGALDMKGEGIVHLMAMLALKRSGVLLTRDIVFIANVDEELGSTGAITFVERHPATRRRCTSRRAWRNTSATSRGGTLASSAAGWPTSWAPSACRAPDQNPVGFGVRFIYDILKFVQ